MKLTKDDVRHIAKLARLNLSDEELEKFSVQLSDILGYADELNEIDTDGVEPIAQITGLKNVSFKDEVKGCERTDDLLEQSPMDKQDHMIKVKNIL